jgi:hypothetical protein
MSKVRALLENEEVQSLLSENEEILEAASADFAGWYDTMSNFILENLEQFLDENVEETYKNVYTFSTFATSQFLAETSNIYGRELHTAEVIKEAEAREFI